MLRREAVLTDEEIWQIINFAYWNIGASLKEE